MEKEKFKLKDLSGKEALQILLYSVKKFHEIAENYEEEKMADQKYYVASDEKFLKDADENLDEISFIFKELAFHAQNGSNNSLINFELDSKFIYEFTMHYNPKAFLNKIGNNITEANVSEFIAGLSNGDPNKSSKFVLNYLKCLKYCAEYLVTKNNKAEVVADLKANSYKEAFNKFTNRIKKGYGLALTLDFLKEFDSKVFNYPKPDLHLRRFILLNLNDYDMSQYATKTNLTKLNLNSINDFVAVDSYLTLMDKANEEVKKYSNNISFPNYILDKIIYILGSGKFYLANPQKKRNTKSKTEYFLGIFNKEYCNIDIEKELDIITSYLQ